MRGESGLYLQLLPVSSPDSVARAGYLAFALGWRVVVPGLVAPVLALAMRLTPHRILVPIVGWLLKPRGTDGQHARR
jgi:short-subunit dehydrogenase